MPGMDGTGPMGYGPMTGGGRGRCNPDFARDAASYEFRRGSRRFFGENFGRGFGMGFGPSLGYRGWVFAYPRSFGWGKGRGRWLGRCWW